MDLDWKKVEESITKDDTDQISETLAKLKMPSQTNGNNSSSEPSENLIQSCLDKLGHHDVVVRSGAAAVLLQTLESNDALLKPHVAQLCKSLALPNTLDLKNGKDKSEEYSMLHKNICSMICLLNIKHADKLVPHFKPIASYLVQCLGQDDREIATSACEYWASLRTPPVPSKLMDGWVPAVFPRLPRLIPNLLGCLLYHDEHVKYLEQHTQDLEGRDTPVSMEHFTNLRNYAALSIEICCRIFPSDATIVLKPLIERWLKSEDWKENEAIILAIGAMVTAVGQPRELRDIYPSMITRLLECYSHPKPLVRSITCFTMQNFVNLDVRGMKIKEPFGKMVRSTLHLLSDYNREVQEMAVQSLSALLAYSERDIQSFSKKLITELVKADSALKGRARYHYYECISHIFGRLGGILEESEVNKLMTPMINQWKLLTKAGSVALKNEDDLMMLCQPLCVVTIYSKDSFSPYNEEIFKTAIPFISSIIDKKSHGDHNPTSIASRLVAYIDLMSAMFEGQGQTIVPLANDNHLHKLVLGLLENSNMKENVYQTSLALLGHLCHYCYDLIQQDEARIIESLNKFVNHNIAAIQNNALWTLSHLVKHSTDQAKSKLLDLAEEKLLRLMMKHEVGEGVLINSTLAMTSLAARWPDKLKQLLFKDDVFIQCATILQRPFPRDSEKRQIFKNLISLMTGDIKAVPPTGLVHFCIAAALVENLEDGLGRHLKAILKEIRASLGNAGWNKMSQQIGPQLSYSLRKRYKLY